MNLTLELPDGPLRRRVLRVLGGFPDISVTTSGGTTAGFGDAEIPLPTDPLRHLLGLLTVALEARTGTGPRTRAHTLDDTALTQGIAVSFPAPTGSLWADDVGGTLLAPTGGPHCGVLVANDDGAYAVSDEREFVEAIVTAAPIVAHALDIDELAAAKRCGLGLAERA